MQQDKLKLLWPLFVKPKEDELLSSWMVRNAHNHSQKIYTFYKRHLKNQSAFDTRLWVTDLDRIPSDNIVSMMSQHTGTEKEKVVSTSLSFFEGRLFSKFVPNGNTRWILPIGHYHSKNMRHSILYCPSCLMSDEIPYFRKKWRLSISFCCPKCSIYLRETCWECGTGVNFIRTELGKKNEFNINLLTLCHKCGNDLREAKSAKASNQDVLLQKRLFEYIESGHTETLNYSHLYFDALYQVTGILLSTRERTFPLRARIAKECGIKYLTQYDLGSYYFEHLETRLRRDILIMATWFLDNWPYRFIELMNETKSGTTVQFLNSTPSNLPFWYTSVNHSH